MTKAEMRKLYAHPGWKWCTFEGAEMHSLLVGERMSFREKLEWLEGAEEVAMMFRVNRKDRRGKQKAEMLKR